MKRNQTVEREIELLWQQVPPDDWIAIVRDPETNHQYEAHSKRELSAILRQLCHKPATSRKRLVMR